MDTPQNPAIVLVVQCDEITRAVCSGYVCEQAFQVRGGGFARYPADAAIRYFSMSCGGCPGRATTRKLVAMRTRMMKKEGLKAEQVAVHLSSCITRDNHHGPRCPHIDYIQCCVERAGFSWVEDSYISATAAKKRAGGIYKTYEGQDAPE